MWESVGVGGWVSDGCVGGKVRRDVRKGVSVDVGGSEGGWVGE